MAASSTILLFITESFSSKKVEVIKFDHGEFEDFSPPQILGRDRKISDNSRST